MGIIKKVLCRRDSKQKFHSIREKKTPFAYTEAFKDFRTNVEYITSVNDIKSVLITSAVPDESKSTVAINLAIALSEIKYSVIIVECDLRKPTLAKYLKISQRANGLSAFLLGKEKLADCITNLDELGIKIIPAGSSVANPSELLNKERMRKMINYLRTKYDYVILDGPPVTVVTDATVVGQMVDGAILVVRSRFASAKTIQLAKQKLESVDIKVLGAVLTRYKTKKWGRKSGYDYTKYKNEYSLHKK